MDRRACRISELRRVARTSMVRHAFRVLTDDKIKTRLIAFSDDMDGLRQGSRQRSQQEDARGASRQAADASAGPVSARMTASPRTQCPAARLPRSVRFRLRIHVGNAVLHRRRFDVALLTVLQHYDAVMAVMLPSLREERAQSYSPFLPISPATGIVLQVPVVAHDAAAGTITYEDPDSGARVTTSVTGGRCSCNGSRTGPCAGWRLASITRWPVRT